jgi:hypothetical protein
MREEKGNARGRQDGEGNNARRGGKVEEIR